MKKLVIFFTAFFLIYSVKAFVFAEALTAIMGKGVLSDKQMYVYLISNNNPNGMNPIDEKYAAEFVQAVIKLSESEGVRSDVTFALIMKETGFLNYGGDVVPVQNNFGGLGATGGGVSGAYFDDMETGILAVVQHLKCYACEEPLSNECADPRFSDFLRGKAPYVEWLGYGDNPNKTGWAVPGNGYGESILKMIDTISLIDDSKVKMPKSPRINEGEIINFLLLAIAVIILAKVIKPLLFSKESF